MTDPGDSADITMHVKLWDQCLGDGNLDAQEVMLLNTLGQNIRDRGDLEKVATELNNTLEEKRERFLHAMAWPWGSYGRWLGECMIWNTFKVTKEKLELSTKEDTADGATNDCSTKGTMHLRELFEIFPTPLVLVLGLIFGLVAMLAQAALDHPWLPDASTVVSFWSFLVVICRILAAIESDHPRHRIPREVLQELSRPVKYVCGLNMNLETEVSGIVGGKVSFGHGSSRRWKVYVSALRMATEKILHEATVREMMQQARTFYIAVILSSVVLVITYSVGYTSWVSWWLGSFLIVIAARILIKFVPDFATRCVLCLILGLAMLAQAALGHPLLPDWSTVAIVWSLPFIDSRYCVCGYTPKLIKHP
jgi:hypothetical protein